MVFESPSLYCLSTADVDWGSFVEFMSFVLYNDYIVTLSLIICGLKRLSLQLIVVVVGFSFILC